MIKCLMAQGEWDGQGHRPWECSAADAMVRIAEDWFGPLRASLVLGLGP